MTQPLQQEYREQQSSEEEEVHRSYHAPQVESEEEEEDEEGDEVADLDTMLAQKRQENKVKDKNRASVSAEAYGMFNKRENFKARVIAKTPEQYKTIKEKLVQSFLFKALEEKELDTCIQAMEIKHFRLSQLTQRGREDHRAGRRRQRPVHRGLGHAGLLQNEQASR